MFSTAIDIRIYSKLSISRVNKNLHRDTALFSMISGSEPSADQICMQFFSDVVMDDIRRWL